MIHPLAILLAVMTVFFAPALITSSGIKTDAINTSRSLETRSLMLETAQILAARGEYDLANNTIILPAENEGSALPSDLPARRTDAWNRAIRYCRGNSREALENGLALVSGGPDNTLETECTDALNNSNRADDLVISLTHSDLATWAGRGESRVTFLNQVEELTCIDPMVIAFAADRWQCVDADELISNALDGTDAPCAITNGAGEKTWNGATRSYGACTVTACDAGFSEYQNSCIPSSIACEVSNGAGIREFTGEPYGPCITTTCNDGYELIDGSCQMPGLQVGQNFRVTCTSLAGRTATVSGTAVDRASVAATSPSRLSTWLVEVLRNSNGQVSVTNSYNCLPRHQAPHFSPVFTSNACARPEWRIYDGHYRTLFCRAPVPF